MWLNFHQFIYPFIDDGDLRCKAKIQQFLTFSKPKIIKLRITSKNFESIQNFKTLTSKFRILQDRLRNFDSRNAEA